MALKENLAATDRVGLMSNQSLGHWYNFINLNACNLVMLEQRRTQLQGGEAINRPELLISPKNSLPL
jgi:hypothetical protein